MSVLALMYHRTPPTEAGHQLDVPMPLFRRQILAMRDAGFRFLPFSQINRPEAFADGVSASITFDDGHGSNAQAMAFLHAEGIPCTSFFISDYVRDGKDGFMGPEAVIECSAHCEVGAHGATHTALSRLPAAALEAELIESKTYLEALCGRPVTTMSTPGGQVNRDVVRAAVRAGYTAIGDSEGFAVRGPSAQVSRICVLDGQTPEYLLSLAALGEGAWRARRLRRLAVRTAAHVLGPGMISRLHQATRRKAPAG